ncbi:MAG: hypothetical protein A3C27_03200 [Candidatus Levybacteria bacterium RIFCSPHIGHO2_02_FULL_39_36]|nr:MAG: hypothetical protein UT20_C0026G0009 [Candidatus Levybacteria bacterium GW2011_GWA1_39_11]KKR27087.1 MAG: hypothetical protein UT57_C0019G0004 [Microgenomates group bacterium GW2011_GWC1_39_7]KKR49664.1 MAG: hypothetical protein UT85_C0013G0009 [Candidatus Levybacteria bacterium GW2011_GWA2_40_16]OGH14720.1 MAG: hypothetical protein A2689_02480 [Candidatus Levybacteria bacterium RIFCSPHIGHO2_01_FULL_38_96]OGH25787.1 MAG: hypothetical protein A3E68_01180 [Candidatus Levybacteria bacteriu
MENHPIPQDVTGFKFKLIGSITIKQFLYLLGFGILATVSFVLNINFLIKIPMMLLFSGIGVALAFIPIEGRPMDVMLANFAKAIPSENRYIYRKRGVNLLNFEFFKASTKQVRAITQEATQLKSASDEKKAILLGRLRDSSSGATEGDIAFFKNIKSFFEESAPVALSEKKNEEPQEIERQVDLKDPEHTDSEIKKIQRQIEETRTLQNEKGNSQDLTEKIIELERQLAQVLQDKDILVKKMVSYEVQKAREDEVLVKPGQKDVAETQNVRFVGPSSHLVAGFPSLPDIPNIILGIVRDPRGKTLPNILVEVVDTNNIPVRAFKTNALGQFASATPLSDGTYKIYFEDPAKTHEFEIIEITLSGEIFNPLEVTSIDSREKLRRELFGGNSPMAGMAQNG